MQMIRTPQHSLYSFLASFLPLLFTYLVNTFVTLGQKSGDNAQKCACQPFNCTKKSLNNNSLKTQCHDTDINTGFDLKSLF